MLVRVMNQTGREGMQSKWRRASIKKLTSTCRTPIMLFQFQDSNEEEYLTTKSRGKDFAICLLFGVFMIPFPVACIVIGIMFHDDCHLASGWIPIYIIIFGFNCLVILLKFLLSDVLKLKVYCSFLFNPWFHCNNFFRCFFYIWIALGCYWIYGNFEPDYNKRTSPLYCHSILYGTSFFVTAILIAFLVFYYLQQFCFNTLKKEFPVVDV